MTAEAPNTAEPVGSPVERHVRPHTTEVRTLTVEAYRDAAGNPTCAADFQNGAVCRFYATQRFGCVETCMFADKSGRYWEPLTRRGKGDGTLIPLKSCPVWPN